MRKTILAEVTTQDGLVHQGIYFQPTNQGKRALIWVHGLTGKFYSDVKIINECGDHCEKNGWGFISFNNRGHDFLASTHTVDHSYKNIGAGLERFEDSVYDIHAYVDFVVSKGYSEVFLLGHSTGANKVCYFASTRINRYVKGIVLCSPISDRLNPFIKLHWFKYLFLKLLVILGRGDKLLLGNSYFPGTPKRFLSLITPRSNEDVFDYGEPEPNLVRFTSIEVPTLVFFGKNDEYVDRPIEVIKKIFNNHKGKKSYKSIIVPGANHGFDGKEAELIKTMINWIKII